MGHRYVRTECLRIARVNATPTGTYLEAVVHRDVHPMTGDPSPTVAMLGRAVVAEEVDPLDVWAWNKAS